MNTRETTLSSASQGLVVRPYAKRGTKTAAREAARKAGRKTFLFTCHRHGLTVFGTAGQGHCRTCNADRQRAAYERHKRAELASSESYAPTAATE
ncbi:hypothetical protein P3T25_003547 [Paraburkholderia sp. GAS32]